MTTEQHIDDAIAMFSGGGSPMRDAVLSGSNDINIMQPLGGRQRLTDEPFLEEVGHAYSKTAMVTVPKAVHKFLTEERHPPEKDFSPLRSELMNGRDDIAHLVLDVESTAELAERISNIDRVHTEDARFAQSSGSGMGAFIATVFAPENIIPVTHAAGKVRTLSALKKNLMFNAAIYGSLEATGNYVDDSRSYNQAMTSAVMATGLTAFFGTLLSPSAAKFRKDTLTAQRSEIMKEEVDTDIIMGERYFGEKKSEALDIRDDPKFDEWETLVKRTSDAEKVSDPNDWTLEQTEAYGRGDWETFSRLRGYTEEEIADFGEYVKITEDFIEKYGDDNTAAEVAFIEDPNFFNNGKQVPDDGVGAQRVTLNVADDLIVEESIYLQGFVGSQYMAKLGYNPTIRFGNASIPEVRVLGEQLVDQGGLQKNKNRLGYETLQNVETEIKVKFNPMMDKIVRSRQDNYLKYRQRAESDSPTLNSLKIASMDAREFIGERVGGSNRQYLNYREFQEEVTIGMWRGDKHTVPEVAAQIAIDRAIYNEMGQMAQGLGMFAVPFARQIGRLRKQQQGLLDEMADLGQNPGTEGRILRMQNQVDKLQSKIERVEKYGPRLGRSETYVPRVWRIDRLLDDEDIGKGGRQIFRTKLENHFMRKEGMTRKEAEKIADDTIQQLINNETPFMKINDQDLADDFLKEANQFRERLLDIDELEFKDFLEQDSEALMRFYIRSTGTDIALTEKFGDFTLADQIKDIGEKYDAKIASAKTVKRKRELEGEKKIIIRDIRAVRDRQRGTFGMPQDPYSPISRTLRALRMWNAMTMLGGAAVSAIPDPARVLMTEGFANTFDYGFRSMIGQQRKTISKMNKEELRLAAVNLEVTLGLRALQFMDAGDMFGRRFMFERQLNNAQGVFFILNGLHMWNNMMKEWAGGVVSARIVDATLKQVDGRLDEAGLTKLRRSGISPDMADQIAAQVREHGIEMPIRGGGSMWMPRTERWMNTPEGVAAAKAYRHALHQDVNRTIVTPGTGDRAVWTSTEYGSMIAQFKSFGQASAQRTLLSGLQEGNAAFFMGGAALIGMGMVVNEIKRNQYNIPGEESIKGKIAEGIDRSGIAGWFMDANNAIETLSDNKLGMRPAIGEAPPYSPSARRVMGTIFGPSGSQVQNAIELGSDVLSGDVDRFTQRRFKRALPFNNHPLFMLGN